MPTLSLIKASGATPIVRTLSLLKVSGTGAAKTAPKLSLLKLSGAGPVTVTVTAPPAQTVEPLATVTLTAALQNGQVADSWTWRQISGQTAGIQGTGATVTLTAPGTLAGTTLVIGVRATVGSTTSTEATVTVTVLPQIRWMLDAAGTWQPLGSVTLL